MYSVAQNQERFNTERGRTQDNRFVRSALFRGVYHIIRLQYLPTTICDRFMTERRAGISKKIGFLRDTWAYNNNRICVFKLSINH